MSFTQQKPAYLLTVRSAMLAFIESISDNVPTYEKSGSDPVIHQMDVIKTLGLAPDASTKKIYASGLVYDVTTHVKGATASLGAVALPRVIKDKALGAISVGGVSYDKTAPVHKEFGFGYYCDLSDGSQAYYFHPKCKLVRGNENFNTGDDGDIDPEEAYDIEILPTHEGVWRVRYYTRDVASGKVPLTLAQFFGALPYSIAEIEALPGLEATA